MAEDGLDVVDGVYMYLASAEHLVGCTTNKKRVIRNKKVNIELCYKKSVGANTVVVRDAQCHF